MLRPLRKPLFPPSESSEMYGLGYGSHFVARLDSSHCHHCHNTSWRELYAGYSSEMMLGVTEYYYSSAKLVCSICHHGSELSFPQFNSRATKWFGGKKARDKQNEAILLISRLLALADIRGARDYYLGLSWGEKRIHRKMLEQLGQKDYLIRLLHG